MTKINKKIKNKFPKLGFVLLTVRATFKNKSLKCNKNPRTGLVYMYPVYKNIRMIS